MACSLHSLIALCMSQSINSNVSRHCSGEGFLPNTFDMMRTSSDSSPRARPLGFSANSSKSSQLTKLIDLISSPSAAVWCGGGCFPATVGSIVSVAGVTQPPAAGGLLRSSEFEACCCCCGCC
uniref:Putative secreted peptide n=1 Tax=Anopheles braziliensis TaxID=58242 RepID=A0A2M3ZT03_9DIPT